MSTYSKILERRSIRKFRQERIEQDILERCINAARLAPSARNLQPLEYVLIDDPEMAKDIFNICSWAGYLEDWGPSEKDMPPAYIIILKNKDLLTDETDFDVGLAAENIILTALDDGVASCCLASMDKNKMAALLHIPDNYDIALTIAFGYPNQKSLVEDSEDLKYTIDEDNILHVPKKPLSRIMHKNRF
jgi:nitroreductase